MVTYFKYTLLSLFLLQTICLLAQEDGGKNLRTRRENQRVKTRLSFSPLIGIYTPNKHHTRNTQQKASFCISVKEEIRLDPKNTTFFMVGIDYMQHGLNFNSYYFYPDSIKLYNGNMRYNYALTIHELDIPLQLKYSFKKETNSIFSSYVFGGYCYRWIIANKLKVDENGNELVNKSTNLRFKIPTFNPVNSFCFNAGIGFQKNRQINHNAVFAELQFRYSLSPFYFNESFSPNSMYISGQYIFLTVGCKF